MYKVPCEILRKAFTTATREGDGLDEGVVMTFLAGMILGGVVTLALIIVLFIAALWIGAL